MVIPSLFLVLATTVRLLQRPGYLKGVDAVAALGSRILVCSGRGRTVSWTALNRRLCEVVYVIE